MVRKKDLAQSTSTFCSSLSSALSLLLSSFWVSFFLFMIFKCNISWEFSSSPVVRTPRFRCWGPGFYVSKCSVVSDSLWSMDCIGHQAPPWNFPGKNTGLGCHFLFQGIFPTPGLNLRLLCLLHWQADSLPLHHLGSPNMSKGYVMKVSQPLEHEA